MKHARALQIAKQIAREAGGKLNEIHLLARELQQDWTGLTHFSTKADKAVDLIARRRLAERAPDHNIYSEEGEPLTTGSQFTWVIDALDGTIGFRFGTTNHWSYCQALCEGTRPVVGVCNAVEICKLYAARLGNGAYCNGHPIRVSNVTKLNHVLMGVDSGKDNRTAHLPYLEKLLGQNGICCPMMTGCASVPLCQVADGTLHAYLATSLQPEDMAAAVIIIREAGGLVTNLVGEQWQLGDPSILAANPELHARLSGFLGIDKTCKT
jgi:myo-inositol-1(or 4)-monophosphatase